MRAARISHMYVAVLVVDIGGLDCWCCLDLHHQECKAYTTEETSRTEDYCSGTFSCHAACVWLSLKHSSTRTFRNAFVILPPTAPTLSLHCFLNLFSPLSVTADHAVPQANADVLRHSRARRVHPPHVHCSPFALHYPSSYHFLISAGWRDSVQRRASHRRAVPEGQRYVKR